MTAAFEITDRFMAPGDASKLLYAPLPNKFTCRKTNRYEFDYEGDEVKLNVFVANTLVDRISQTMFAGDHPAVGGALFAIDYGMKPGALDLEKEAILSYYRGLEQPGFELKNLRIRRRVYVFAEKEGDTCDPQIFIRDLCNGAIHNWRAITFPKD